MKRTILHTLIVSGIIFTSCSSTKQASIQSQKLLTSQDIAKTTVVIPNAKVTYTDNQNPEVNPCNDQINPSSTIQKPVRKIVTATQRPVYAYPLASLKPAFEKTVAETKNLIKKHTSLASYDKSKAGPMDIDAKTWWIICGIATIVFIILNTVFVHMALLYLITGILLLISFMGLLIFLGLWLWQMKQAKK